MQPRHWTILVTGLCLLIAIVWDSIAAALWRHATISEITAAWAIKHTISVAAVAFVLGVIFGHLFWYQSPSP